MKYISRSCLKLFVKTNKKPSMWDKIDIAFFNYKKFIKNYLKKKLIIF